MSEERILLNSYQGIKNYVSSDELRDIMIETLDTFVKHLTTVCGPFARYSMVLELDPSGHRAYGSDKDARLFTKDGRITLERVECVSPIEQYLKSIIVYIGKRIDSACHDGTTTSMILACLVLKYVLEKQKELEKKEDHTLLRKTTLEIEQSFTRVFNAIACYMEDQFKITVEDIEHTLQVDNKTATKILTYIQAQTSSGGDYELSKAISTFYDTMPKCTWTNAIQRRLSAYETHDYRIKAETNDYEVELESIFLTHNLLNYDNKQYYRMENIDVLVLSTPLMDNNITTMELYKFLEDRTDPLFLFVQQQGISQSVIGDLIAISNKKNFHLGIATYKTPSQYTTTPIVWSVVSVCGKANVPPYDEVRNIEGCIIHGATVFCNNKSTRFSNITPNDDRVEDKTIHPGEYYPEDYPHYTELKEKISLMLKRTKESHNKNEDDIESLERALATLPVRYPTIMRIGGYSHEANAMIPVLEDAAGASMSVVEHGCYLNNIYRLYLAVIGCRFHETEDKDIADAIQSAIEDTILCTFGPMAKHFKGGIRDKFFNDLHELHNKFTYLDISKNDGTGYGDILRYGHYLKENDFTGEYYDLRSTPPMQPAIFIRELFDRIKELVVRVSLTSSLIVPGAAWMSKTDTE